MEALMSHFLLRASGVKRPVEDSPLDLTQSRFTRHTCDRLIEQEDFRREPPVSAETEYVAPKQVSTRDMSRNSWHHGNVVEVMRYHSAQGSCDSVSESSLNDSTASSVCSDDSVYIKREAASPPAQPAVHPFSIAALIGDTQTTMNQASAPAVVYSAISQPDFLDCAMNNSVFAHSLGKKEIQQVSDVPSSVNCEGAKSVMSFWCHVCNALCLDVQDAHAHQYLHQVQQAKCSLRKALFYQHGYVSMHVKMDEEKMKCGLCDKVVAHCFFTKHQRLHDGHFCDICNREFSTNSRLQDHMNIHNGNTPFTCTICERKFAKKSSLTQHQRYHRDHQSFKCSYCEKSFSSKYVRTVHERLHTGDFPFKCNVPGCTRAFPQKIQLQLHMNSHQ